MPELTQPEFLAPDAAPATRGWQRLLLGGLFAVIMGTAVYSAYIDRDTGWRIAQPPVSVKRPASAAEPFYHRDFAPDVPANYLHSATALETRDGRMLAAWYAGAQEGTRDTRIHGAYFDPASGQWSDSQVLLTRQELSEGTGRHVKKLGNPLLVRLPDQRLGLVVVSTAAFGWAASNLNVAVSSDEGGSWDAFRHLQLSSWFNISTLVRGSARAYADGDLLIPVYHEFMGKFGEILRLDENLEVVAKQRLTWGRDTLQPAVAAPSGENGAVAFLRSADRSVHRITMVHRDPTTGEWGDPVVTSLPNPNAGLDALRAQDGSVLLVFNDDAVDRKNLTLARSTDNGSTWQRLAVIEKGDTKPNDVSYPSLLQMSDGSYQLLYSWRTKRIRHVQFNQAWVDAQG